MEEEEKETKCICKEVNSNGQVGWCPEHGHRCKNC